MDYPKSAPGIGLVGGKFIDENVQTGQQGSLIPAAWGNAVTDEILAVIAGAGLTPSESAYDQLLEAIETLIASGAATYEDSAAVLLADGVASAGTRNTAARGDHRHPTDTSREPARTQATQAEMEAGTLNDVRGMSPLRVKQAIAALASTPFASSAENAAGTVNNKAVNPLGIREAFNASGSAPVYACRAWVNFNGTGTVAIRGSGNVTSITDNGTGKYTVNFTTNMPDANYAVALSAGALGGLVTDQQIATCHAATTTSASLWTQDSDGSSAQDASLVCAAFFR